MGGHENDGNYVPRSEPTVHIRSNFSGTVKRLWFPLLSPQKSRIVTRWGRFMFYLRRAITATRVHLFHYTLMDPATQTLNLKTAHVRRRSRQFPLIFAVRQITHVRSPLRVTINQNRSRCSHVSRKCFDKSRWHCHAERARQKLLSRRTRLIFTSLDKGLCNNKVSGWRRRVSKRKKT